MNCRESLSNVLSEAAREAGGWRQLGERLDFNHNFLWRTAHPGKAKKDGKLYAETLPRARLLEKLMNGLGLVFTKAVPTDSIMDVLEDIWALDADEHTRVCMVAAVHAIWDQRKKAAEGADHAAD